MRIPLVLLLAALASPVMAQEADAPAPAAPAVATEAAQSDQDLADLAGGQDTTIALTDQDLTGISTGNQINGEIINSGAINFSDGALSNFGGIGNFVVNTGHNNVLQGSLSVTVIVTD